MAADSIMFQCQNKHNNRIVILCSEVVKQLFNFITIKGCDVKLIICCCILPVHGNLLQLPRYCRELRRTVKFHRYFFAQEKERAASGMGFVTLGNKRYLPRCCSSISGVEIDRYFEHRSHIKSNYIYTVYMQ